MAKRTMEETNENARRICEENGYEGKFFTDYSYDTAIIGFSHNDKIVYSYEKMIDWLIENTEMNEDEAIEWIDYNTLGVCHGEDSPVIVYGLI